MLTEDDEEPLELYSCFNKEDQKYLEKFITPTLVKALRNVRFYSLQSSFKMQRKKNISKAIQRTERYDLFNSKVQAQSELINFIFQEQ